MKTLIRRLSVLCAAWTLTALTVAPVWAASSEMPVDYARNLYAEGNLLYQREKYEEAIDCYRQILALPYEAWEVYYNLGNAYYKTGAYSRAILSYERADRLKPGQADIRQNLALCRTKITDDREALPSFFLQDFWRRVVRALPANAWAGGLLGLTAGLLLCLVCYFLRHSYSLRRATFYGAILLFVAAFITLMACFSARHARFKPEAIIMVPQSEIKARPEASAETRYLLHEGNKVEILDEIAPYCKIKMSDGNQGWIPAADIEKI
ncbi:MAG: tetratricopeptide repeat protein [Bacteroidales bacterium]|nr:tetratricopeptide repeat protein [Bacteroidales bacterium]